MTGLFSKKCEYALQAPQLKAKFYGDGTVSVDPIAYQLDIPRAKMLFLRGGIPDANLHTLRKTAGARLIQKGVDIYRVSKFLGHSSVIVTEKHRWIFWMWITRTCQHSLKTQLLDLQKYLNQA